MWSFGGNISTDVDMYDTYIGTYSFCSRKGGGIEGWREGGRDGGIPLR